MAKKSPTKQPAKKAATGKAPSGKPAAPAKKAGPAKKAAPAKTAVPAKTATKPAARAPAATKPAKKAPAAKTPTTRAPAKEAAASARAPIAVPKGSEWTHAELRAVRAQLLDELDQMAAAYDRSMSDLNDLQLSSTDGSGDDQADAGNKTFEREQEQSIAANRADLLAQMRRAVERIDAGTYGFCESCGKPIPKARLKAFPSATLDVGCKQREERR